MSVPSESALVEDELIPLSGYRGHVAFIHLIHIIGLHGGDSKGSLFHVGHPDGDAALKIAVGGRAVPAEAGHFSQGYTGLLKLTSEEELLTQ